MTQKVCQMSAKKAEKNSATLSWPSGGPAIDKTNSQCNVKLFPQMSADTGEGEGVNLIQHSPPPSSLSSPNDPYSNIDYGPSISYISFQNGTCYL